MYEAYSAGVEPQGMNPRAVQVMQEAGIDLSQGRSKHVSELAGINFDVVITVCGHARETCPVFPGVRIVSVSFDDPPRLAESSRSEEEVPGHYQRAGAG